MSRKNCTSSGCESTFCKALDNRDKYLKEIKKMLKHRIYDNATYSNGKTLLHKAIKRGDLEIVKKLLQHGANVNESNFSGNTLLFYAVRCHRNLEIVKKLLECGADANKSNHCGNTPLHIAVMAEENQKIVTELLQHGVDVNVENVTGFTPLHFAVTAEGNVEVVQELLKLGANASKVNMHDMTPLHLAASNESNLKIVKELLLYVPVNMANSSGDTPLHSAVAVGGNLEIVRELLKHGANASKANNYGVTPLHLAASSENRLEWVKALQEARVANNEVNSEALSYSGPGVRPGVNLEIVEELLQYRAEVCVTDQYGNTPLSNAVMSTPLLRLLIKYAVLQGYCGNYKELFNSGQYERLSHVRSLSQYFEDCVLEIVQMKTAEVGHGLSLYSLFTTKNLNIALYPDNYAISHITDPETLISNYKIYGSMVFPTVKYALERAVLLGKLDKLHVCTYACDSNNELGKRKVVLNGDCVAFVCKYLSNEDMGNFISTFLNFNEDAH